MILSNFLPQETVRTPLSLETHNLSIRKEVFGKAFVGG